MSSLLFYVFSALILGGAAGVIVSRNAVTSAFSLLLSLLGVAALFVLLDAYLLAVLMVLVYAGAVAALFVFIVMLIGSQGTVTGQRSRLASFAAVTGAAILLLEVLVLFVGNRLPSPETLPSQQGAMLKEYGYALFTTYMLPVQVVGFLLLISMIGVIALSRKQREESGGSNPESRIQNSEGGARNPEVGSQK